MGLGEIGKNAAEVALTKKLAATLVQQEVIEPMTVQGWQAGQPISPAQAAITIAERARAAGEPEEKISQFLAERGIKYTPPAGGPPAKTEGAPAPAATPAAPATSGQPAPATSPAPAAPAKTDAPADANLEAARTVLALFESLKGPDGKYMGKYPTLEEALKGAGHLANMTKSVMRENDELKTRLTAAPAPTGSVAPPAAVPAAAPARKPFVPSSRPELEAAEARLAKVQAKIDEHGFDGDSAKEFAEATREVAKQTSLAVAAEAQERQDNARREESEKWDAVNQYMLEKYPDSANVNDDEFGLFLRTNPLLVDAMTALRAQGRDQRAAELGYTEFVKARSGVAPAGGMTRAEAERKEEDLAAREQVRKELRDQALKDAGIVHGSAGGSSSVETPGVTGPSQDDINAAAARMRREGDAPGSPSAMEWRRMTIGRFLPPDLFGPGR